MVSLDYLEPRYARRTLSDYANLLPALFGLAAALLAITSYARSGPDSWGASTDLVLRFAILGFPFAIASGPLGRLILGSADWRVGRWSRMGLLSFAAVYAVFILCVALPYFATSAHMPLATTGFCFFNGFIVCVLAITASEHFSNAVGNRTVDTLNRVSISYFWLVFAFADVAHLYGPHRPDGFFGLSLSLLVAAVLVRFADAFIQKLKAHWKLQASFRQSWQEKGDDCHSSQPGPVVQLSHVPAPNAAFGRHARLQERADPGYRRAAANPLGRE